MDLYITCSMRMRLIRELLQRQKSAIFFQRRIFGLGSYGLTFKSLILYGPVKKYIYFAQN